MKLISVTLANDEASDIIQDALASVHSAVDRQMLIYTGDELENDASVVDEARRVAGDKFLLFATAWVDDFSLMRNRALDIVRDYAQQAFRDELTSALMLDSDERIVLQGENLRETLEEEYLVGNAKGKPPSVFEMFHDSGTYRKEKVFLLPAVDRYTGPTHEAFPSFQYNPVTFAKARFSELRKSEQQLKAKRERDFRILSRHILDHPKDARWRYYLGDTLEGMGYVEDAIASFKACNDLHGWPEEGAWACYRAATLLRQLKRRESAIEMCIAGLASRADIAELYWLGGLVHYENQNYMTAIHWASCAIHYGEFSPSGYRVPRIGFRYLPAHYEAPFDTLRFAYKAIGEHQRASEAERQYHLAKNARLGTVVNPV